MKDKTSAKEIRFLEQSELCRIATMSKDGSPHLVPVNYILYDRYIYIFTDYGTKKLRNIEGNRRVAILVDEYRPNKGVLISGKAEVIHKGEEYVRIYRRFYEKFGWVRAGPWKEGEAPLLKISVEDFRSWGLR